MAWLLTRGEAARKVRKYDLKQHSLYGRLPEAAQAENSGALKRYQNETAGMAPAL